ncbi:thrombospondin type 3 repeat-containing protein [Tenacibaculum sp.]|uniref:thrombospondin type 3 repeat-containing protein n=1 Tax=Tenacibaculum sp. TaxID=1906242 RepID=UPI003D0CB516
MLNPLCETGYETRYLGTNESNAKNIVCSGNASNSGNLSRFNVLSTVGGSPLETNKLYKNNEDDVLYFYYIVRKNTSAYSDRDSYSASNFTKLIPFCDNDNDGVENSVDNCVNSSNPDQADSDGDGVGNVCDSCPTQAGPSSNNGCPVGNPDLKPSNIIIYSECTSCSSNLDNLGSNKHIISRNGGILSMNIVIENIGNANSYPTKINFYTSLNGNTLDASDYKLTLQNSTSISSINKGSYKTLSTTIFGSEIKTGDSYDAVHYGNYYIIGEIENINESNDNNNTFVIPIYFREYMSKTPTQLTIHDINGNKIEETTINSKSEETEIIKKLPKGLYFINKDGKKSKIYKKN